ncbi:Toxin RelE3 [Candidatus Desulfarcum epimagneticum]|uniref:Toxin RelE3 n=1 Tax=uncultured Desulfobacteraceae bacterium TaxID=218296 RepID=A0A484HCA7_9BACT|nr:Toxin RelE3 [uncultured Desulfobacteraceae bacterium]
MILDFKKSFAKDLKKRKTDKQLMKRARQVIQAVEAARDIRAIRNLKKLKAQGNHYRIRVGAYRLGLIIEDDTVCFVRCLHRSEIYRYFP